MTIANMWSGIGKAEIFERGRWMSDGFKGVVEVKKTIAKPTRKSGLGFVVEFVVRETNMPEKHAVGTKGSWFQKMIDPAVAFPAVKEWAAAMNGYDPRNDKEAIDARLSPILDQVMQVATDNPDNPEVNGFIGVCVGLECYQKKTQNDRDFTVHNWTPVAQPKSAAA